MITEKRAKFPWHWIITITTLSIFLSSCSVIDTGGNLIKGYIQSKRPREDEKRIGDLRLNVWCSQAVYDPDQDPFKVGMRLSNQGDDLVVLFSENGPLAQLIIDQPRSFPLIMEAGGDEPGTRIELGPGETFEMVWNLGVHNQSGPYYIKAVFWTEKHGQNQGATDCII